MSFPSAYPHTAFHQQPLALFLSLIQFHSRHCVCSVSQDFPGAFLSTFQLLLFSTHPQVKTCAAQFLVDIF